MSTSRHLTGLRRFAKAAVAVCASLGLVLAAGGCGASSGESKTIYFWNNLVGDDGPAMQRIVKEYNAQSDYKVVFQPMNGGDLTTKIYSVMQTGKNIPDIIIGDQFQTAVLQSQGLLDTMDDWQKVAPDLKESSFLPATWKGVTVNGKAYGIPLYLYQMAIYYNKDLVKKYNLQYILDDGFVTIDEIKDLKGKLPKGTYALTYGNLPWAFMSLLYGAGGTLENDMDDLTKDVWRKPMEKLKEAYDAGVIAPMDVDGEQAFGSGKAVFAQLGTWAQGNMSNTLGADKIAEANTLQYSADNPVNFFYQCNWMQLKDPHRSAAKSAAAADFVKYVYEHWMDWSEVGSISPAYRDLNNPEYQKLIQASFTNSKKERDYIKTSNYLYGGYATAGWGTYNDIVYGPRERCDPSTASSCTGRRSSPDCRRCTAGCWLPATLSAPGAACAGHIALRPRAVARTRPCRNRTPARRRRPSGRSQSASHASLSFLTGYCATRPWSMSIVQRRCPAPYSRGHEGSRQIAVSQRRCLGQLLPLRSSISSMVTNPSSRMYCRIQRLDLGIGRAAADGGIARLIASTDAIITGGE